MASADEQIYEKYSEELIRFATFLVGPSDAPDVLSEAMLKVLASNAWANATHHRAYLHRAVLNEARMAHRHQSRRRSYEERAACREEMVDPATPRPEVLAAVECLSTRQRAVVFLTYWDDLDPGSVAGVLGISEGAVRRHLARARHSLRRSLDDS
jgi:RNA polymerase sigma factor (sigma-70 family)